MITRVVARKSAPQEAIWFDGDNAIDVMNWANRNWRVWPKSKGLEIGTDKAGLALHAWPNCWVVKCFDGAFMAFSPGGLDEQFETISGYAVNEDFTASNPEKAKAAKLGDLLQTIGLAQTAGTSNEPSLEDETEANAAPLDEDQEHLWEAVVMAIIHRGLSAKEAVHEANLVIAARGNKK